MLLLLTSIRLAENASRWFGAYDDARNTTAVVRAGSSPRILGGKVIGYTSSGRALGSREATSQFQGFTTSRPTADCLQAVSDLGVCVCFYGRMEDQGPC